MTDHAPAPLLHSKKEAAHLLRIGETSLWKLCHSGQLKAVKVGGRTLIPDSEIRRYVADLLAAT